jgi:hypothetical protein
VSVLTIIKSAVRDMGEIARDNSENITVLSSKQQRLAAVMRELSGYKTPETLDQDSRNSTSSARRVSTGSGVGAGGRSGLSPGPKGGVSPKSGRYSMGSGTGMGSNPGSAVKGSNGLSPLPVQSRPMLSSLEGAVVWCGV